MSSSIRSAALAFLGTAALSFLGSAPAGAVVVNVNGQFYDVTAVSTSYAASAALFQLPPSGAMPWWGDDLLASEFAAQVFNSLGAGTNSNYGPVFAYAQSVGQVLGIAQSLSDSLDQIDVTPPNTSVVTFAIARSPVPGPIPLLGSAAALCWSRKLRRRIESC